MIQKPLPELPDCTRAWNTVFLDPAILGDRQGPVLQTQETDHNSHRKVYCTLRAEAAMPQTRMLRHLWPGPGQGTRPGGSRSLKQGLGLQQPHTLHQLTDSRDRQSPIPSEVLVFCTGCLLHTALLSAAAALCIMQRKGT